MLIALGAMFVQQTFASVGKTLPAVIAPLVIAELHADPAWVGVYYGLSAADLADQIGKAHRLEPVGRIERGSFAYSVIVNSQGETAQHIEDLLISAKNNQPLRVRDVATVKILHTDRVQSVGFAGQDAVVATIFRSPGGNTINISHAVEELLARQSLPANIKATVVYDQARFVSTAIDNVRDAILVGGLFSILILLAFLRSWRATLISALAIPTTLAITFLFLHWSGETLNLMSLGGLAVGGASVVSPLYIAEIAPARFRGRLVAIQHLGAVR